MSDSKWRKLSAPNIGIHNGAVWIPLFIVAEEWRLNEEKTVVCRLEPEGTPWFVASSSDDADWLIEQLGKKGEGDE